MKDRSRKKKKTSIFRIFLIPLIVIMLVQSAITIGTLVVRHTAKTLEEYSSGMMRRLVENRKVILQSDMNQRWSVISEQEGFLNNRLQQFLMDENVELDEMLRSKEMKDRLLDELFPKCLDILQNNTTTGIFLVLTGTDMEAAAAECRRLTALTAEPSGRKLYLLPPGLDKGAATEKACGFFDADVLICAGDSALDLPMLRLADLALVPDRELAGRLAALSCAPARQREIRVCPQGVRFSEFVLTQVLKAAEGLLKHSEYTRHGADGGGGN